MSESKGKPIRARGSMSLVLLELAAAILFFALSASVVLRLFAAASEVSNESAARARALLAMESVAERVKADPEGGDAFDARGERTFMERVAPDLCVCGVVRREISDAGAYYRIDLSAAGPNGAAYGLSAARYVSNGGAAP